MLHGINFWLPFANFRSSSHTPVHQLIHHFFHLRLSVTHSLFHSRLFSFSLCLIRSVLSHEIWRICMYFCSLCWLHQVLQIQLVQPAFGRTSHILFNATLPLLPFARRNWPPCSLCGKHYTKVLSFQGLGLCPESLPLIS